MLFSLACIFLSGMFVAYIFKKLKLPSLFGMLLVGILFGPCALNILDSSILSISNELRQIALIIILARVGLSLDIKDLKKVGRPAILMCWVPAVFEIIGVIILAPYLLKISILDAAIMGTVLAAVSPAVIVPKMFDLMSLGYGKKKCVPQLLMAGASVDDIFVIVLFTSFTAMALGDGFSVMKIVEIPAAMISGIATGFFVGCSLAALFRKFEMRGIVRLLVFLSFSFLFVAFEKANVIPFSGLLAIISAGLGILKSNPEAAEKLSDKFGELWVGAEILLFVLVGAAVNVKYALLSGALLLLLIVGALLFRICGVWCSLLKSTLNQKEKLFCMIAYTPKATVQAAIGAIPLSMGLPCGEIVLSAAVISILLTAPSGAMGIDLTYKRLLADDFQADQKKQCPEPVQE